MTLLSGRKAFVTGGGRGIGSAIAEAMAIAGADVVISARDARERSGAVGLVQSHGRFGSGVELDLREPAQASRVIEGAIEELGGLDILVCNSGVAGASKPVWALSYEEWQEVLNVNLTGAFVCVRAAARALIESDNGVVILVGSVTGKRPLLHRSAYAASKLGLVGFCRTIAHDLGPFGVRANVISPGFVDGPRLDWVVAAQAASTGRGEDEEREFMSSSSPLGRLTAAADVAGAAVFLASDGARGITGQDLNVATGAVMY